MGLAKTVGIMREGFSKPAPTSDRHRAVWACAGIPQHEAGKRRVAESRDLENMFGQDSEEFERQYLKSPGRSG